MGRPPPREFLALGAGQKSGAFCPNRRVTLQAALCTSSERASRTVCLQIA